MKLRIKPNVLRAFILFLSIVGQLAFMIRVIWMTSQASYYFDMGLTALSIVVVLYIVKSNTDLSYKLVWVIVILSFPVFGGLFYMFFGMQPSSRKLRRDVARIAASSKRILMQAPGPLRDVSFIREDFGRHAAYLSGTAGYPVYGSSTCEYFTSGEAKFERLKAELEKAERFIFLEYFIIDEGVMWNAVLDILSAKAASGLDVRVLYDDIGCMVTLPPDYSKQLEKRGIRCKAFNPAWILPSKRINYRDHRKLVVIDGRAAFTGGVNLADEYINKRDKYGHWKDAAVFIAGDAVRNFTVMFLDMWNLQTGENCDYNPFIEPQPAPASYTDYVQPYGDNPLDNENVSASAYLAIINSARHYVYITTPYLILDSILMNALCLAAKSGVDVRIITPRHFDKWIAHTMTRSYYDDLVSAGVKVYEYVDGFMHAKTFVSDDAVAVVGTINLDYRSLYLHYECGAVLYGGSALMSLKEDYLHTLERCDEVRLGEYEPKNFFTSLGLKVLRLFAPMM